MQVLNKVIKLLKGLSIEELEVLRKYLQIFSNDKSDGHLHAGRLLEMILESNFSVKEIELKKEIRSKTDKRYFDRVLLYLKNKIHESYILDVNVDRKNAYSDVSKARINIKKQFLQAFIVLGKGQYHEAREMYLSMILKAKEFELYDDLVEILRLQKTTLSLTYNSSEYKLISNEIAQFEECRKAVWKAKDYYYELITNVAYKADNGKNFIRLVEAISDLEHELLTIDSANIKFYLLYLKAHYYQENRQHEKAQYELETLVDLLNTNKAVYVPFRMANALMNLGENFVCQNKFKDALKVCAGAEKLVKNNLHNYAALREIEFNANFYLGNYNKALNIVNELLLNKELTTDDFRRSKRYYMKASVCFMQGKHYEVKDLLDLATEIKADKEGWNVGIRILEILNLLEISSIDKLLSKKIESFRKFAERQIKNEAVTPRDLVIKNLLVELEKLNFDFNALCTKRKTDILKLAKKETIYSWKFPSSEFVLFHEWLECKRAGTKYTYPLSNTLESELVIEKQAAVAKPKKEKVTVR